MKFAGPVERYKIMKFENVIGAATKQNLIIFEGLVTINEEIETSKRKRIKICCTSL